jgi:hypothetical protein
MAAVDFRIAVPDAVLVDLHARLARSRFSPPSDEREWQAGTDPDYLRDLVAYWVDRYDWRHRGGELNALPSTWRRSADTEEVRHHRQRRMKRLWSLAVATGGNRWASAIGKAPLSAP